MRSRAFSELVQRRFHSANRLAARLAEVGIEAKVRKREGKVQERNPTEPVVIPRLPEIFPGCFLELRLSKAGLANPPEKLHQGFLQWRPFGVYRVSEGAPVSHHVPVLDRDRMAAWVWWKTCFEKGLFADPPPESWQEVSLPEEVWENA